MAEDTRMNQMGDNRAVMKKQMEKYDKEFEEWIIKLSRKISMLIEGLMKC
jgi:hypothetical protein